MTKAEIKHEEAKDTLLMEEGMTEAEEMDYVAGFLKAAEMLKEETKTIKIKRNGIVLFKFKIHALSEQDMMKARKMATSYMSNPRGKKLPKIEKEYNKALGNSCLIYLATTEEDKKKLWDNQEFKDKFGVIMGYEMIDMVLSAGEKSLIIDEIDKLCGYADDEEGENLTDTEIAKN